tara:strand:- start:194154 stop:194303 length:150 start_codon:yes stop_codon:yes gene_type:complete
MFDFSDNPHSILYIINNTELYPKRYEQLLTNFIAFDGKTMKKGRVVLFA